MTTVAPIIEALKQRFRIRKVVFVCDRGMVSKANLDAMEAAKYEYIVGMKMRNIVEVRDDVLGRAGRYHEVADNLRVKEVWVEDERRYIGASTPTRRRRIGSIARRSSRRSARSWRRVA